MHTVAVRSIIVTIYCQLTLKTDPRSASRLPGHNLKQFGKTIDFNQPGKLLRQCGSVCGHY